MAKLTLDISYDYDFGLIAISSHEKDYRLCWALNKTLGFDLRKTNGLALKDKKQTEAAQFVVYSYNNEDYFTEYIVIANRSEGGMLVPEQKQADYFLMIRGAISEEEKDTLLKKIKEISMVQTAYLVDPNTLKSKQNFVF